jgi:nicotinate-nucleotide adenylyltransferase
MTRARRLGLFGGTFDPIHVGHLDAAEAARSALGLDEVRLLPTRDPPHRTSDPRSSPFHRFALAALAIDGRNGYRVSDLELRRPGRSYTIDTLRALHARGWPPSHLFFILGTDAFAEIATWHEYPAVLDAANFAVIVRPGTAFDDALERVQEARARPPGVGAREVAASSAGVFVVEAHTRDVSSTMVRARLAAGDSIDGLVPPAVARHIHVHHLYQSVGELHDEHQDDED